MKILFITRGYPSDAYKTLGIFEYDMAKALTQAGHVVTYVAVDMRSLRRKRKWGSESFVREGIQIEGINMPLGRIYNPLKTKISLWLLIQRYKDLKRLYGPFDVIHGHFIGSAYLGAKLKDYTGIPLVITEHSSKLSSGVSPYIDKKLSYAYERADQLTTVSHALSEIIENKYNMKSVVIPNVVNTKVFSLKKSREKISRMRFVSTGNLIRGKGMDLTIEAFSKLLHQYPDSELWIFGEGPERGYLQKLIEAHDLLDKVFLKGLVSREALNEAYEECDFYVLASHSETFGVSYIEALAKGIPVVATDCGGPKEFVHNGNGVLVPANNKEALLEGMLKIIKQRTLYNAEVISEEIKNKYSPIKNAISLERIYNSVVDKNKS